jgi:hypothetical protein
MDIVAIGREQQGGRLSAGPVADDRDAAAVRH